MDMVGSKLPQDKEKRISVMKVQWIENNFVFQLQDLLNIWPSKDSEGYNNFKRKQQNPYEYWDFPLGEKSLL